MKHRCTYPGRPNLFVKPSAFQMGGWLVSDQEKAARLEQARQLDKRTFKIARGVNKTGDIKSTRIGKLGQT